MKNWKKIVLLVIAVLLVGYLGYRIWFYTQYHIDMDFTGTLVLPDGNAIPMALNVEGYVSPAPDKDVTFRGKNYKTKELKLAFKEISHTTYKDVIFNNSGKWEDYFTDYWDVPYVIGTTTFYEEQEGVPVYADYALSVEEGLLYIYSNWHGFEEGYQDDYGYIFYGSVDGDATLEEILEYFSIIGVFVK